MVDSKTSNQYNNDCPGWNDRFPPLNLWNYNLYWRWAQEWQTQQSSKDTSKHEHAS